MLSGTHTWSGTSSLGIPWEVHRGDAKETAKLLRPNSIDCVVTSPPYYWQRDYDVEGQLGQESSIQEYVSKLCDTLDAIRPSLKSTAVVFLNIGDTYYSAKGLPKGDDKKNRHRRMGLRAVDASGLGVPRKTAIGIPWRVALELINRKWILRSPIVWHRASAIPEPTAKDRPWRTYEHIFMFTSTQRYWFDREKLGGDEDVWVIPPQRLDRSKYRHSAPFPDALAERCIEVGAPEKGVVLDPFVGSGTSQLAASRLGRASIGIELNPEFCKMAVERLEAI